ncbi:MAG: NapC/NirT family cytochrome c [Bacteroidales bacterium]|nr:NapC/NirT family cytochrome c [Bacteroidales bacterium]
MKKFKLPQSYYNWTSIIGTTIALVSLFMIVFLFVISILFGAGTSSYMGLVTWIVLPVFLVLGLIIIPIGMLVKRRKDKRQHVVYEKTWPKIDLNDVRTRNATMIFGIGTVFFLLLSSVGSYEAFHYTESVEFCGTVCHKVMKPEYVAYQNSPHAKVACVECHVGSGANWYVRSKLSGLYQVYAVLAKVYPKPIPTPVSNLRPARETCEECHWPEKFYSRQLVVEKHYLADEENTEWDISLQMKTGPTYSALGLQEGIHWHINPNVKVEYIATDTVRQNLPWVRFTNLKTGEVKVFEDEENKLTEEQIAAAEIREMDCMDCHNRPSHDYRPPMRFINDAITAGNISKEIPEIKMKAMEILGIDFPTTDSAMAYIEQELNEYYSSNYEEFYSQHPDLISAAITNIQNEFKKNIFPEMKVRWNAYHNNIGHMEFNGCFRCHNDKHKSERGEVITRNCNLCHSIVAQGVPDTLQVGSIYDELEFVHPNDPYGDWKEYLCVECHSDLY